MEVTRKIYDFEGTVQGVGFRPAIYRLAQQCGVRGWVRNQGGGVRVDVEGKADEVRRFFEQLPLSLPPQSQILKATLVDSSSGGKPQHEGPFRILESSNSDSPIVSFPPDLAICQKCSAELADPQNRRFRYPFTTCTDCGPRYTVITGMPYDRERTTLNAFPLCRDCQAEYDDPGSRRFHAESIACPRCGPRLFFVDGGRIDRTGGCIALAQSALADGRIVAVRGIGGFHLAVDAFNEKAVLRLRARKNRPAKPFAVMVPGIAAAERYCFVSHEEARALASPGGPIVILQLRRDAALPVDALNPDGRTLGVMLPTTPLHQLLFSSGHGQHAFEMLVMTSGNKRSEPICIKNEEAFERLAGVADCFLCHDREIELRADDSLMKFQSSSPQLWRRSRGFAPDPVLLSHPLARNVLALGAELKNTIALGSGSSIRLSPHVGDLETPEAQEALENLAHVLPDFLNIRPQVIAVDKHPDMFSSKLGRRLAKELGLPICEIQHHAAHAASCMAENGCAEALALVFDGTGLGDDGSIWGAELFHCCRSRFRRLATFAPVPLPGGDAAVKEPRRQLIGRWLEAGIVPTEAMLGHAGISAEEAEIWFDQARKGLNAPLTHSAGRLFDACSALLGFSPKKISYEGQAAIRLEAAALEHSTSAFSLENPFILSEKDGIATVDWTPLIGFLSAEGRTGSRDGALAFAVHDAVADAAAAMIEECRAFASTSNVVLSGGVFMNTILSRLVRLRLESKGLRVLSHSLVPPNDGGISFGQAYAAGMGWEQV